MIKYLGASKILQFKNNAKQMKISHLRYPCSDRLCILRTYCKIEYYFIKKNHSSCYTGYRSSHPTYFENMSMKFFNIQRIWTKICNAKLEIHSYTNFVLCELFDLWLWNDSDSGTGEFGEQLGSPTFGKLAFISENMRWRSLQQLLKKLQHL